MRCAPLIFSAITLIAGCAKSNSEAAPSVDAASDAVVAQEEKIASAPSAFSIENIIWFLDDAGAPPGAIRIFAADGSLLMDSCYETFRIARWRRVDDDTIAWTEDTAEITADIVNATATNLTLAVHLKNETVTQAYSRRDGEYLCPSIR